MVRPEAVVHINERTVVAVAKRHVEAPAIKVTTKLGAIPGLPLRAGTITVIHVYSGTVSRVEVGNGQTQSTDQRAGTLALIHRSVANWVPTLIPCRNPAGTSRPRLQGFAVGSLFVRQDRCGRATGRTHRRLQRATGARSIEPWADGVPWQIRTCAPASGEDASKPLSPAKTRPSTPERDTDMADRRTTGTAG
jgi:hypothetical protein